jgi:hypothetical protein
MLVKKCRAHSDAYYVDIRIGVSEPLRLSCVVDRRCVEDLTLLGYPLRIEPDRDHLAILNHMPISHYE